MPIDSRFTVLDIGSSNQRFSDALSKIENKYIIGFEPDDRSNCEQENSVLNKVYNLALSEFDEERDFYFTRKPECSSFFIPNKKYLDLFPNKERWDIVGKARIHCKAMDSLYNEGLNNIDFIKIDTQGSELEILRGGRKVLNNVLGVEVEAEFIEMYEGQPLFGDVCGFLNQVCFEFYDFITLYRYGRQELNKRGQLAFSDALFLRTPEFVINKYNIGEYDFQKVNKYTELVSAYGKNDLAEIIKENIAI